MINGAASPRPLSFAQAAVLALLAFSRAAAACGLGMIFAERIRRPSVRQGAALTLLSLGLLANVPSMVGWFVQVLNRPETLRGSQKRLRSIRGDFGGRLPLDYEQLY